MTNVEPAGFAARSVRRRSLRASLVSPFAFESFRKMLSEGRHLIRVWLETTLDNGNYLAPVRLQRLNLTFDLIYLINLDFALTYCTFCFMFGQCALNVRCAW